jgi:hypothetical protein
MRATGASRRIGLVWRRGYPKAEELSLLGRPDPGPTAGRHAHGVDGREVVARAQALKGAAGRVEVSRVSTATNPDQTFESVCLWVKCHSRSDE